MNLSIDLQNLEFFTSLPFLPFSIATHLSAIDHLFLVSRFSCGVYGRKPVKR
jgi:hypothetical protein